MLNFQDFKNATTIGDKLIILVDDVNNNYSFGFTDSVSKINYNLETLNDYLQKEDYETLLANSKEGLTTLFPLGRYISILRIKKDKSAMSMFLFDFRAEYSTIDQAFKDVFSENIITQFKKIKYQMEELFDDESDCVLLDTTLEPPTK